jgi:CelD/BcsL family acetyltransferase involved in cellulose biosynthesis
VIRVEQVSEISDLARFKDEWKSLDCRSAEGTVFETYEWLTTWLDCFWKGRQISFLFLRDENSLVGMVPLLNDSTGDVWCAGALVSPINGHSPWANVLYTENLPAILEAALNHLANGYGRFSLAFTNVLAAGSLVQIFPEVAKRLKVHTRLLPGSAPLVLQINSDWDTYLKSRSRHTARETKRKVKRFDGAGHAERVIFTGADCLDRAMEDILHIEENSWKEEIGSSFTARDNLSRFYGTFATLAAQNDWLRIYLLYLDSKPVAHIYGAVYRNHYYALKTSYHSDYRHLAPGIVLFDHAFRDAFARKLDSFHLLGQIARWKQEFANDIEKNVSICAFSKGLPHCVWCDFYQCHLKGYVKTQWPFLVAAKKKMLRLFAKK